MATMPGFMSEDADFAAEIAEVEGRSGPLSDGVVEARWRAHLQARRCAAGEHVYTWTGKTVDVPGDSLHEVMACAYAAAHHENTPSPHMLGPVHTPENAAKRLWTAEELRAERKAREAGPEPPTPAPGPAHADDGRRAS